MTRVVVVGDLMTDTVAHAALPLARGSDTPAVVTMHGGGSGANIAAWLAVDGAEVAFVGRRGAEMAGRTRSGCPARRWRSWSTGPAPATRSAPGSCLPGWTRSRPPRRWSAAAA